MCQLSTALITRLRRLCNDRTSLLSCEMTCCYRLIGITTLVVFTDAFSIPSRWTTQRKSASHCRATLADTSTTLDTLDWESQWYPVASISQLDPDAPQACTILGKKLVVWKSDLEEHGTAIWSAFDDTCPHRKTSLSTGKITKDCRLACRMHGWQFDKDGRNNHVPMMDRNMIAADQKSLGVSIVYPTQTKGDILWAFLNPRMDPLPELREGVFIPNEELGDYFWVHNFGVAPISYESMIENSFDPSHAPFVHEKKEFRPSFAIPMETFQVVDGIRDPESGFTVEHSPYQTTSKSNDTLMTTRQFIPPCTQITDGSFGKVRIQFVPSTKRETRVLFTFGIKKPKNRVIRKMLSVVLQNDFLHTIMELSEGRRQFNDQDRIIMQDQDDRKMMDGKPWNDMRPTISDVGVATYQKWMNKFGKGGPFANMPPSPSTGANSMWEFHGQHCVRCKRTLKGLVTLEKRASAASKASLVVSIVTGILVTRLQHTESLGTKLWPVMLVGSLVLRWCASWAAKMQSKMILTNLSKRQNQNIYAY